MITLFIFSKNTRGMQYGIGTYLKELVTSLLTNTSLSIYLVCYHSNESNEFNIRHISDRYGNLIIPSPMIKSKINENYANKYAAIIVKFISEYVPKTGDVIFQMNHLDDLPIINKLKESYKYPVISVIHFAQWQLFFYGNRQKLRDLQIDRPSRSFEFPLFIEKFFCTTSDHIVSVTQYMKDFLVDQYGISQYKITVIYNGLDLKRYSTISQTEKNKLKQKMGFRKNEIILLFSGRIDSSKGIFPLLEAFKEASQENSNLRLIVMGDGRIEDCQKKIQPISWKVTITGFLPKEKVLPFYQVTDIGIAPSLYDYCPYSVLEMMASKIPLILSRTDGLDELLSDAECIFVDPIINYDGEITIDIPALRDAILILARDKQLRSRLAIKSHNKSLIKFSSTRMADEMNCLFTSISVAKSLNYSKNEQ